MNETDRLRPEKLVEFGARYVLGGNSAGLGQTVTLTARPGPSIFMEWGMLAVTDPWWPPALPEASMGIIGRGDQPTTLSTISFRREDKPEPVTMACAASVGPVDQVAGWQPIAVDEQHFHLDSDSALGVFYDISGQDALDPLFQDGEHMQQVYNRALEEQIVAMEIGGRAVAAVFLCPDGSGLYPAYLGYDKDMRMVAALVDLLLLTDVDRRLG